MKRHPTRLQKAETSLFLNVELLSTFVRFFLGASGASGIHLFSVISFIACTCPNRSGVGAIDNPGLLKQVLQQCDIPDIPEKNFEHDFSIVCCQKMFIFSLSTAFISNFSYYNLY